LSSLYVQTSQSGLKSLYGGAVASGKKKGRQATPRDDAQPGDVIPSLMDALSEAMVDAKKEWADVLPLMRKDDGKPLGEKQVKRYLAGTHYPTGKGVDLWTRAVATVTGTEDRFVFWRTAIAQASEDAAAGRAAAAARKANLKSRQKSPGMPSPKGKTGQGG
jgi:hypothetical protein